MSKLIAPARGEQITLDGRPTVRASALIEGLVSGLNAVSSTVETATASRTTTTSETVLCTGADAKTITLNESPEDQEFVTVIRQGAGAASLSGDINGGTSYTLATQYDSVTVMYTQAAGEWSVIGAYVQ